MIAIVYRWRIAEGKFEAFRAAWTEVTLALRERGALGSALFAAADGTTYAIARWPDLETRRATSLADEMPDAAARMRAAIVETHEPVVLDELVNLWAPVP